MHAAAQQSPQLSTGGGSPDRVGSGSLDALLGGSAGSSGSKMQKVDVASSHAGPVQASSQVRNLARQLSYTDAGRRLHNIFGHTAMAEMFGWKIGDEPLREACRAAAEQCTCKENAAKKPRSHAREPAREKGDIQVDVQHIRGLYILVAVDRFS
eukprot:8375604-Prorocentrum_lima.AAC.1